MLVTTNKLKLTPVEFLELGRHLQGFANNLEKIDQRNARLTDIILTELYQKMDEKAWKWKHYRDAKKNYPFSMSYSQAQALATELLMHCPNETLQEILKKLHKSLIDTQGLILQKHAELAN
jgi:hypothetical protein